MSKVINSIENKPLVWLGVLGVVGTGIYFGVKAIKNAGEQAIIDRAEQSVSEENPWSYTKFLSQRIPTGTNMYTVAGANAAAKQIYGSLDTYLFDSEDICIGVFSSMSNKLRVAQVAQAFFNLYKRDILQYLKNGNKTFSFGTGGLSNDDYERILTIVKNKPKF